MNTQKGVIHLLVPIIVIAVLLAIIIFPKIQKQISSQKNPSASSVPLVSPSATPLKTPAPEVLPTPSPTIKPSTPKPTPNVITSVPGSGYTRGTVVTEKGSFTASVLSVDLNSARMVTDTGNDNDCGSACSVFSLMDYVNRNGGFAGVNGTYFCPAEPAYASCGAGNNYDFPVWNSRLGHWINGGNLFWNDRAIFYTDGSGAHYLQNANSFSGSLNAGVVNYPGLLDNGQVQIDDNQSGLSDKQKSVGTKVGIGLKNSKSVIVVVASSVNMQQFAYVFKALGAQSALNLDTGGSTAMFYNGKYIFGPGRSIPNAIIFAR